MAWIESHQALREHPKTLHLCSLLKTEKPAAIGYLHLLWWWCIEYAPDGNLKKYSHEQIAKACEWSGNADDFVTALQKSGFIDRYRVHDWVDFTLHYNLMLEKKERQREQVRERVKRFRNAHVTQGNEAVTLCNAPTVPNHTVPNHIKKKNSAFTKPSPSEVTAYGLTINFPIEGKKFCDHYEANGWRVGRNPMRDWRAAVRTWKGRQFENNAQVTAPKVYWVWKIDRVTNKVIEKIQFKNASEAHAACEKLKDELDPEKYTAEVR